MTCNEKVMKQLTAISVSLSPAVCTLHIDKIPCALRNAYPSVLLGGIVFHLQVWLSVVKQQHLLFWIFFSPLTRTCGLLDEFYQFHHMTK